MQFAKASSSTLFTLVFSTVLETATAQVTTPAIGLFKPNSTVPVLDVTFGSTLLTTPGTTLPIKVTVAQPSLTFTNSTTTYLALMLDFSVAGVLPDANTTLIHWLQPSLTGPSLTSNATALVPYGGPAPPPPSTHIYSIRLYKQPSTFQLTPALTAYFANISAAINNRLGFDDAAFVKDTGLGDLVAENYFLVTNDTAAATATGAPSANVTAVQAHTSGAMRVGRASGFGFVIGAFAFGLLLAL